MYPRGAVRHRFINVSDRFERLVFDFDQVFRRFEDCRRFGDHEAERVADVTRDAPDGDHDVPVLLDMADFIVGDVFGGQDVDHAGERTGGVRIDREDARARIGGTDRRRMDHAFDDDVVDVFADAENLIADVDAERLFSDAESASHLELLVDGCFPAENCGDELNPFNDFRIPGTAADIPAQRQPDFILFRVRVLVEERLAGYDHAWNAEAALDRAFYAERVNERLFFTERKPFDRQDRFSRRFRGRQDAAARRFPVDYPVQDFLHLTDSPFMGLRGARHIEEQLWNGNVLRRKILLS